MALLSYLALTAVAVLAYRTQEARATQEAKAQLTRLATGNATLVSYWFTEAEADIRVLGSTSRVRSEFESYLKGDKAAGDWIKVRLEAERRARNYVSITVFDTTGKARIMLGAESPGHVQDLARFAVQASKQTTGTVVISHPGNDDQYHVAWFAPLRIEDDASPRTTGVVMYEADLKAYLEQVVAPTDDPWPTTVALRVSDLANTYVASSATDFAFSYVHAAPYPGGDVLAGVASVGGTNMDVMAFTDRASVRDALAWERWTIAGLDVLVFVTFAGFVLAFVRSDRNRRRALLASEQIADALATQDRFLANMSHDLRTPLNSIIGFSSVLAKGMAGPLNEEQVRQLNMIEASGKHLLAMVTDVLELSKMKAGMEEVDPETFPVSDVVGFVSDVLAPQVAEKGLSWGVRVPEGLEVTSDRRLVERVLLNLAGNAVKFTVNGGIEIVVTRRMGEIAIAVHDTGPGIEPESHREIMREFRQVYTPGRQKPEGSGLGLAISQRTAELLGGAIEVQSEPGHGATFTFVLPVDGALL